MTCICLSVTGDRCKPITVLANTKSYPNLTVEGSKVTYTCTNGYTLDVEEQAITCKDAVWIGQSSLRPCSGNDQLSIVETTIVLLFYYYLIHYKEINEKYSERLYLFLL